MKRNFETLSSRYQDAENVIYRKNDPDLIMVYSNNGAVNIPIPISANVQFVYPKVR